FSPTTPLTNETVNFDGTPSTAPSGRTITLYEWSYGDGEADKGQRVQHRFTAAGTYSVILKVTDSTAQTNTTTKTLVVTGASTQGPTADFDISPNPANTGQAVTVDASKSTAQGGQSIASYEWNFGD